MNQVIQLTNEQFETLIKRLNRIESIVTKILKKEEALAGTKEWWNLSDRSALEDIKKGNYTVVSDKKELMGHLDSL